MNRDVVFVIVAAIVSSCSSSSAKDDTDGPPDPCAPASGAYTLHYTRDPSSSTACPDIPDEAVQADGKDAGTPNDAGPGCTTTKNACATTIHCAQTQDTFTTTEDRTITSSSTGQTGTLESHTSSTDADAGVNVDCKYTFELKKQ